MKTYTRNLIEEFFLKWPEMASLKGNMKKAIMEMVIRVEQGGKILICGNGGSAADSEHIAGELLKEFYIKRPLTSSLKDQLMEQYGEEGVYLMENLQGSISAISLVSQTGFLSAYANDAAPDLSYAQQVLGYGKEEDTLIALSTSGNAKNVNYAAMMAKVLGVHVVSFTGETGGKLKDHTDVLLNVPETETYLVQERHLPLYHLLCRGIEFEIFGEES